MRRYDALSHNSYLLPIGAVVDAQDGAPGASRARAFQHSVCGETKVGTGRFRDFGVKIVHQNGDLSAEQRYTGFRYNRD